MLATATLLNMSREEAVVTATPHRHMSRRQDTETNARMPPNVIARSMSMSCFREHAMLYHEPIRVPIELLVASVAVCWSTAGVRGEAPRVRLRYGWSRPTPIKVQRGRRVRAALRRYQEQCAARYQRLLFSDDVIIVSFSTQHIRPDADISIYE